MKARPGRAPNGAHIETRAMVARLPRMEADLELPKQARLLPEAALEMFG